MSRLGGGVVDAYLKHRKTTLQFDCAVFCAFLGAELCLQSSIDFEGKTGFWQFARLTGHLESMVIGWCAPSSYGESGTDDKPVPVAAEGVDA